MELATITCASASTAAWALYACSKLFDAPSFIILDSGSVKFLCDLDSGTASSGLGTFGGRPPVFRPLSCSLRSRSASLARASSAFASACSFAAASRAALASLIFFKRLSRRARSPGISSARRPLPYFASSSSSTCWASFNRSSTSCSSLASVSDIRL